MYGSNVGLWIVSMLRTILRTMVPLCGAAIVILSVGTSTHALPLSPGDRIKVSIPEGEEFNGIYEVNFNGNLEIPYLPPLSALGLEPEQVQQNLTNILVDGGFFQPSFLRVSVNIVQWAPVAVFVSGTTFQPGRVLINEPSDIEKNQIPVALTGRYTTKRSITEALQRAGGIKPNADVQSIQVIRNGQTRIVNLYGVFSGEPFEDVPLISGDRVVVPDLGRFNNALVRPSQITPPGVKVLLSNLTLPAPGNAGSGITKDSTSFAYGSRFSHAVVAGNCAGGTRGTNAGRRAVLVSTDPLTGKTKYLERKIEDILLKSTSNDDNPFMMENDAIACYDSKVTQLRDIVDVVGKFFTPLAILRELFR
jgi:polysaccharide biosynthesis/export protein